MEGQWDPPCHGFFTKVRCRIFCRCPDMWAVGKNMEHLGWRPVILVLVSPIRCSCPLLKGALKMKSHDIWSICFHFPSWRSIRFHPPYQRIIWGQGVVVVMIPPAKLPISGLPQAVIQMIQWLSPTLLPSFQLTFFIQDFIVINKTKRSPQGTWTWVKDG